MKIYIQGEGKHSGQRGFVCEDCHTKFPEPENLDPEPRTLEHHEWGCRSDEPQHCRVCEKFLKTPLNLDGENYVVQRYEADRDERTKWDLKALTRPQEWANYYSWLDLPKKSFVVWFGHSGFEPLTPGADLSCSVFPDLEAAKEKIESLAWSMQPGDSIELIDANPEEEEPK